jgi:hypothetical protein
MEDLVAADKELLAKPTTDIGCPVIVIRTVDGKRETVAHLHDAYEGWQIALDLNQGYAYRLTPEAQLARTLGFPPSAEDYKILTRRDFK